MASQRTDEPGTNELAALVGPFWSEARVCDALGINADALTERRDEGTVLGLTTSDGALVYPVAQFHRQADGGVEVSPALVPLMTALRGFDPWTVAVLLYTPAPELNDLTPLDWVRRGGSPDALSGLGQAVSREWSTGTGQ